MGIDIQQIKSPCYVLEERLLLRNLELLKYVQQRANCHIICALKGFSMYSTFNLVRQYLQGATASSLHEARLCFEEMKTYAHVYAPVYFEDEMEELLGYTSHITFNSINQYNTYKDFVQQYSANHNRHISCGLRINPQYSEVETDMYNPCIAGSRLGITANYFGDFLPEGIEGLHFHTLCEKDSYTLERTLQVVEQRFGHLIPQCKWINMGGGHLITRKDYEPEHLIQLITTFKEKYKNVTVILEPGSAVAWQTGYLVASVMDIFDSQGIMVAVLDVSFAAHMPDCLEMPYKPRIWGATDEPIQGLPTYRLGGTTCLAGDYIGDYSFQAPLQIGDKLVFDDMIHYTMVKTTTFNGVKLPSIAIWHQNNTLKVVRTFGYESFKDRLS